MSDGRARLLRFFRLSCEQLNALCQTVQHRNVIAQGVGPDPM